MSRANRLAGHVSIFAAAIALLATAGCSNSGSGIGSFTLDLARHWLAAWVL